MLARVENQRAARFDRQAAERADLVVNACRLIGAGRFISSDVEAAPVHVERVDDAVRLGGRCGDVLNLARQPVAQESFRHEQHRLASVDAPERSKDVGQHREHPARLAIRQIGDSSCIFFHEVRHRHGAGRG